LFKEGLTPLSYLITGHETETIEEINIVTVSSSQVSSVSVIVGYELDWWN
jgi:hypothetical protein